MARRSLVILLLLLALPAAGCGEWRGGADEPAGAEGEEVAVLDEEEFVPETLPAPDPNDDRSIEQRMRDASLAARVRIALVEERRLRRYDIETEAEKGVVRLRGFLPSVEAAELAGQIARVVDGVRAVENLTEVPAHDLAEAAPRAEANGATKRAMPGTPIQSPPDATTRPAPDVTTQSTPDGSAQTKSDVTTKAGAESPAADSPPQAPAETPATPAEEHYTVRSGDSLWEIARAHNTSVEALKRLNNLRSNTVRPGQRLRVR